MDNELGLFIVTTALFSIAWLIAKMRSSPSVISLRASWLFLNTVLNIVKKDFSFWLVASLKARK